MAVGKKLELQACWEPARIDVVALSQKDGRTVLGHKYYQDQWSQWLLEP